MFCHIKQQVLRINLVCGETSLQANPTRTILPCANCYYKLAGEHAMVQVGNTNFNYNEGIVNWLAV